MKHQLRVVATLGLFVLLAVAFTGCQRMEPTEAEFKGIGGDGVRALYNGVWSDAISEVYPLWAGQHTQAGIVRVWNDHDILYVAYEFSEDWAMTEAHVAVGASLADIPQKNGNPNPGAFPYKETYDPPVKGDTFEIDLNDWTAGTCLFIATHCVAVKLDGEGNVIQEETGWGGDEEFPGRNWARYLRYCIKKVPLLPPSGSFTITAWHDYVYSYWRVVLDGIGEGYDLWDGTWYGWCAQKGIFLPTGTPFQATLYSSYDPALPGSLNDPDWDMVNYIMNHRIGTWREVQEAMWYFVGGGPMPPTANGQAMVTDALANGEGYYPGPGELLAIVVVYGTNVQPIFIEIDP